MPSPRSRQARWDWRAYFDADRRARDKIYSKWGGFLDDVPFDPMRVRHAARRLPSIDPLQLLTLEVVRAGPRRRGLPRSRVRPRAHVGDPRRQRRHRRPRHPLRRPRRAPDATSDAAAEEVAHAPAGVDGRFLRRNAAERGRWPGRQPLRPRRTQLHRRRGVRVVAGGGLPRGPRAASPAPATWSSCGGVDTVQEPVRVPVLQQDAGALPDAAAAARSMQTADGIAISEGTGEVVLKRLEDAERDGDRIYAVIKGVAGSSDGRATGSRRRGPRPGSGARARLRGGRLLARNGRACRGPRHGHRRRRPRGGRALTRVFGDAGAAAVPCHRLDQIDDRPHQVRRRLAGLLKVALALYHKVLPPTLHVKPNAKPEYASSPFFVNTEARPWIHANREQPRRAAVSSFGFGGTNFHAVLEEYQGAPIQDDDAPAERWPGELFMWRGERSAIAGDVGALASALDRGVASPLRDLAHFAWRRAEGLAGPALAIVATSVDDLRAKLQTAASALAASGAGALDRRGIYLADSTFGR